MTSKDNYHAIKMDDLPAKVNIANDILQRNDPDPERATVRLNEADTEEAAVQPNKENTQESFAQPNSTDSKTDPDKHSIQPEEESPYAQHCRDNAKYWSQYLKETDVEDKQMTSIGNSSLDSMLTFAGLFASVLAAFLTESRKDLKEDPQERLLIEIRDAVRGLPEPLPRAPFQPSSSAVAVNTLWFSGLTLTLLSALAGVLAKGWLAEYNPPLKRERSEDAYKRQYRFHRAEAWQLETVISFIPLLIQISLFLFFTGLLIQIQNEDIRIRLLVLTLVIITATLYLFSTVFPAFVAEFPFPTPLSRWLEAIMWLKYNWKFNGFLDALNLLKEFMSRACRHYDPMDLELQILSRGIHSEDEETTGNTIEVLAGMKQTTELRKRLYNHDLHRAMFDRLQQKLRSTNESSPMIGHNTTWTVVFPLLMFHDHHNHSFFLPLTCSGDPADATVIPTGGHETSSLSS